MTDTWEMVRIVPHFGFQCSESSCLTNCSHCSGCLGTWWDSLARSLFFPLINLRIQISSLLVTRAFRGKGTKKTEKRTRLVKLGTSLIFADGIPSGDVSYRLFLNQWEVRTRDTKGSANLLNINEVPSFTSLVRFLTFSHGKTLGTRSRNLNPTPSSTEKITSEWDLEQV